MNVSGVCPGPAPTAGMKQMRRPAGIPVDMRPEVKDHFLNDPTTRIGLVKRVQRSEEHRGEPALVCTHLLLHDAAGHDFVWTFWLVLIRKALD